MKRLRQTYWNMAAARFTSATSWKQFPEFEQRFRRFLEDHGHRELDIDYSQPTWSAAPWVVLDSIVLILRQPQQESPAAVARLQRLQYSETELAFLSAVPEQLRFFFRELINLARTYTLLDDLEHYQTTRINPLARQAALAMGRRLVERGIIDDPNDVFFFYRRVVGPARGRVPACQCGKVSCRQSTPRKASYLKASRATPKWSLDEHAATIGRTQRPAKCFADCRAARAWCRATAFLVHDPADFARFPAGSILVARTTNPAWTPLFYSASGLITESGGPLSHGAVTAREMQLPAVMSVRGVMKILSNGETVTVDGNQGIVKRANNAPSK